MHEHVTFVFRRVTLFFMKMLLFASTPPLFQSTMVQREGGSARPMSAAPPLPSGVTLSGLAGASPGLGPLPLLLSLLAGCCLSGVGEREGGVPPGNVPNRPFPRRGSTPVRFLVQPMRGCLAAPCGLRSGPLVSALSLKSEHVYFACVKKHFFPQPLD